MLVVGAGSSPEGAIAVGDPALPPGSWLRHRREAAGLTQGAKIHLRRGAGGTVQVVQPEGTSPAWLAMYDPRNRMVVAVNFNTDVGDAWEFADVPYYPEAMTALAYRYGINYIIYAMTH